jgi:hypothetical protein
VSLAQALGRSQLPLEQVLEHPFQANIGELEIELRVIGKTADAAQGSLYASLLASPGSAEALGDDIARRS